jgi:hypothetical protein
MMGKVLTAASLRMPPSPKPNPDLSDLAPDTILRKDFSFIYQ